MRAYSRILSLALILCACSSAGIKTESNESVRTEVEKIRSKPELYSEFKAARSRMIELATKLIPIFKAKNVPTELLAMPIVQSNYLNLPEHQNEHIAGLWSFSPYTANMYGLNTEAGSDDRLDPVKETEAAADYLIHLHNLFQDWRWAILAYTYGEGAIEAIKDQKPNLSPWEYEARFAQAKPRLTQTWAAITLIRELNHD